MASLSRISENSRAFRTTNRSAVLSLKETEVYEKENKVEQESVNSKHGSCTAVVNKSQSAIHNTHK